MALRFHYKNSTPAGSGYLFLACAQDYELFSTGHYEPLPSLTESAASCFIADYNDAVSECLALNSNNKYLFMTPFATRNTWQSSFYQGAESYARLRSLNEGNVYFYSPEWFLWACRHMKVQADVGDMRQAKLDMYRLFRYRLFMAYQGVRFSLACKVPSTPVPHDLQLVLASVWTTAGRKTLVEHGRDPFYGELSKWLNNQGYQVAIAYHAEGWRNDSDEAGPVPTFNFAGLLNPKDWFSLAGQLTFFRMKLPLPAKFPCAAIYRDVSQSLSNQLPLAIMSYKAATNLLRANPKADFLALYENNCWEQGVMQAVRENGRRLTGYQHTSFAPAALKMDRHIKTKAVPDRIITSGRAPADTLTGVMGHNLNRIVVGGSLRHEFSNSDLSGKGQKILVLLQGAPDDALLLHTLSKYLDPQDVIVRCHPSWPVLQSSLFKSSSQDLQSDLSQSRAVLYTGTTAAFEALSARIPVIHVNLGAPLSTDPLFALKDCLIKRSWLPGEDLKLLLAQISALSQSERAQAHVLAHRYIQDYFSPADENFVKQVIHG